MIPSVHLNYLLTRKYFQIYLHCVPVPKYLVRTNCLLYNLDGSIITVAARNFSNALLGELQEVLSNSTYGVQMPLISLHQDNFTDQQENSCSESSHSHSRQARKTRRSVRSSRLQERSSRRADPTEVIQDQSAVTQIRPRLDPELKQEMLNLVLEIQAADEGKIFADPVSEDVAPGYFRVVKNPVDLSTIR